MEPETVQLNRAGIRACEEEVASYWVSQPGLLSKERDIEAADWRRCVHELRSDLVEILGLYEEQESVPSGVSRGGEWTVLCQPPCSHVCENARRGRGTHRCGSDPAGGVGRR